MSAGPNLGLRAIVVLIAVSVPIWLGLETAVRVYLIEPVYGPLLAEMRDFYYPELSTEDLAARATQVAWALIGVTALAGVVGLALLPGTVRRGAADGKAEAKVRDSLLLMTSIPQVPGLLSTLCLPAGAALAPVLTCVGLSTAFVVAQGFVGARLLSGMSARAPEAAQRGRATDARPVAEIK